MLFLHVLQYSSFAMCEGQLVSMPLQSFLEKGEQVCSEGFC